MCSYMLKKKSWINFWRTHSKCPTLLVTSPVELLMHALLGTVLMATREHWHGATRVFGDVIQ